MDMHTCCPLSNLWKSSRSMRRTGIAKPYSRSAMIAPSIRMGGVSTVTMALGALPVRASSRRTALAVLDPFSEGKKQIRRMMDSPHRSCLRSMIVPVWGSTPPQKLIGSSDTNVCPDAEPRTSGTPRTTRSTAYPPSELVRSRPSEHSQPAMQMPPEPLTHQARSRLPCPNWS